MPTGISYFVSLQFVKTPVLQSVTRHSPESEPLWFECNGFRLAVSRSDRALTDFEFRLLNGWIASLQPDPSYVLIKVRQPGMTSWLMN